MRWRRCSKTVSKRSETRKWIILTGLVLVTSVAPALEVHVTAVETALGLDLVYEIGGIDAERLVESLAEGHVAELQFAARLYRPASGLAAVFGDQIEVEHDETITVRWDVFSRRYVATVAGQDPEYFDSIDSFLARVSSFRMSIPAVTLSDRRYFLARVALTPERIPPALSIVEVFFSGDRVVTPWIRVTAETPRSER